MARQVKVQFGGAERVLHLDARDAIEIKKTLGKNPKRVLDEDIAPEVIDENGKGTGKVNAYGVDAHALVIVLWLAIRKRFEGAKYLGNDPTITYEVVVDWISEYLESNSILKLVSALEDAMYISGMMGVPIDWVEVNAEIAAKKAELEASGAPVEEPTPAGKAAIPSTATPNQ